MSIYSGDPQLIRHFDKSWLWYRTGLFNRLWRYYLILGGFYRTFVTGAASKQRTLTPPDAWSCHIWDLHLFLCWDHSLQSLSYFQTFGVSNISWFFFFDILKYPSPKCYITFLNMTKDSKTSIDQTLHQFMTLLPNWTLWPALNYYLISGGFLRTLQRVRLANRWRLLFRTAAPVPLGTCIRSNVESIFSWTCHVLTDFEFRTSLGTFILLWCSHFLLSCCRKSRIINQLNTQVWWLQLLQLVSLNSGVAILVWSIFCDDALRFMKFLLL